MMDIRGLGLSRPPPPIRACLKMFNFQKDVCVPPIFSQSVTYVINIQKLGLQTYKKPHELAKHKNNDNNNN